MIEDDVRGHAGTSNSTCRHVGPEWKVDGSVCDRTGHGNEGACSSSHGEDSKGGNEEVHLNESSGHDPAVLAKEEEEEHAAGVYFFWVDNEDEEGSRE